MRRGLLGASFGVVVVVAIVLVLVLDDGSAQGGAPGLARSFLHRYVLPDGRVVRIDQGSDTVSEGQAYGLLLAEQAGDPNEFARIWRWTSGHLQRSDGLLAWHAAPNGKIEDSTPAADADVLSAWALSRARGAGSGGYHRQARRIAAAVLREETVQHAGKLVLTAGPWADGPSATVNPSYWALPAFSQLARFTGDPRWGALGASATQLSAELSDFGRELPPDWGKLTGGRATPIAAPQGAAGIQYGLDAQRLPVWLNASCTAADRNLAARWWRLLSDPARAGAISITQPGTVLDRQTNALPYVAAAASAQAAGDRRAAGALMASAQRAQASHPTYYGGAWLALGSGLLHGDYTTCRQSQTRR